MAFYILVIAIGIAFEFSVSARGDEGISARSLHTKAFGACTEKEKWFFSKAVSEKVIKNYFDLLQGKTSPALVLSEAQALRKKENYSESRKFTLFTEARGYYELGLIHLAHERFNEIASSETSLNQGIGIQVAAIECLNQIQRKYPRLGASAGVAKRLAGYLSKVRALQWKARFERVLYESALTTLVSRLKSNENSKKTIVPLLGLLEKSGPYGYLARGLFAVSKKGTDEVIRQLEAFLSYERSPRKIPRSLARYLNDAKMTLARAYYQKKDFRRAAQLFNRVEKGSNQMVRVLSELSWVYLMEGEYGASIGTAMNFEGRGFRNTFAPEALMVMTMALNELCLYPDSLRSLQYFRKNYRTSYQWLKNEYVSSRSKEAVEQPDFYEIISNFLEKKKVRVPHLILSEWIRSPVFITHQEEINLLFDEIASGKRLAKSHASSYRELKFEIRERSKSVREEREEAIAALKGKKNAKLPKSIVQKIRSLNKEKRKLANFRKFKKPLDQMLFDHEKRASSLMKRLVQQINSDISFRNKNLFRRLKKVASNTHLIEIEIYNGASEDVIWRNANADLEESLNRQDRLPASEVDLSEKFWNWGPTQITPNGGVEVWSDELGHLRAGIEDQCFRSE